MTMNPTASEKIWTEAEIVDRIVSRVLARVEDYRVMIERAGNKLDKNQDLAIGFVSGGALGTTQAAKLWLKTAKLSAVAFAIHGKSENDLPLDAQARILTIAVRMAPGAARPRRRGRPDRRRSRARR